MIKEEIKRCPYCGEELHRIIKEDSQKCIFCGNEIELEPKVGAFLIKCDRCDKIWKALKDKKHGTWNYKPNKCPRCGLKI